MRWLGAFAFGIIALWDIPTCFAVKELRKPSFLLHHFAMAAVGGLGAYYCPTYYGLFFLGVVEASSVPLSVYEGLERASEIAGEGTSAAEEERCARLKRWRDAAQAVATAAFLFTRLYLFTRVTFFEFWPDALAVLPTMAAGGARNTAPRRGPARRARAPKRRRRRAARAARAARPRTSGASGPRDMLRGSRAPVWFDFLCFAFPHAIDAPFPL